MAGNPRIDELRKKLDKDPGSRLFAQLAEELRKDGDLEDAIRVAREGLQKHSNYPSARMTLGRALFDTGDWAAARAEFELVLKGAPDNILASRLLAESLESLGDVPGAVARYKKTLALAPGDKQVLARLEALEKGSTASAGTAAAGTGAGAGAASPGAATGPARPAAPAAARSSQAPSVGPAPAPAEPAPVRVAVVDAPMELEQAHEHGPLSAADPAPAPATVAAPPEAAASIPAGGAGSSPAPIPLVAAEEDFELERPYERPAPGEPGGPAAPAAAEARPIVSASSAPAPPPHAEPAMEFDFDAGPTGSTSPFAPGPAPAPAAPPGPPPAVAVPEPEAAYAPEPRPPSPANTVELPGGAAPAAIGAAAVAPEPAREPARAAAAASGELLSATLAELYFNQGFADKAIEVYRQLLEREPDNGRLRRRLAELQGTSGAPEAPNDGSSTTAAVPKTDSASRRLALERTIARLEGMLAAIRKG